MDGRCARDRSNERGREEADAAVLLALGPAVADVAARQHKDVVGAEPQLVRVLRLKVKQRAHHPPPRPQRLHQRRRRRRCRRWRRRRGRQHSRCRRRRCCCCCCRRRRKRRRVVLLPLSSSRGSSSSGGSSGVPHRRAQCWTQRGIQRGIHWIYRISSRIQRIHWISWIQGGIVVLVLVHLPLVDRESE